LRIVTFYRRNLPHIQKDYSPHFITFATNRRRTLPDWARAIVLSCCIHGHGKKYNLHAAVVMPDHVHLILTLLIDPKSNSIFPLHKIPRSIKSFSARRINLRLGGRTLWQEESFDHVLRSSESLDAKVAYIVANPVRKGLVSVPEEYPWLWRKAAQSPYAPGGRGGPPLHTHGEPGAVLEGRRYTGTGIESTIS
jgi:REP element-mobilizing transposase RayT